MVAGLSLVVAFLAGVVSFASPCCLPMVPVYVGYLVGTTEPDDPRARSRALRQGLAFVTGFVVVFVLLWASVGVVGYLLRDYVGVLRVLGGIVLIVMGLHVAGLVDIPLLYREARIPVSRLVATPAGAGSAAGPATGSAGTGTGDGPATATTLARPGYARSVLLGVVFAAGWTPCVGPILGAIIGLASVGDSVAQGALLLVVYGIGLGTPFLLVAVGAAEVNRRLQWFRRHHAAVSLATGGLLVVVGFLMITNLFVRLSGALPAFGV